MRIIKAAAVRDCVRRLCVEANVNLPQDVCSRIRECRAAESWPAAVSVMEKIEENFALAREKRIPICQDTGITCVFLDVGDGVYIEGDIREAVNEGVRLGSGEGYLRSSMASDPLRRVNTGDNTPAMLYIESASGGALTVTVAPKGAGSENMSRVKMLTPSGGRKGIVDFVLDTVLEAGPNPCPPIVAGIGIGGSFDKAALLSKRALLRPIPSSHPDPLYAGLEAELLEKINALGIGPAGYGGKTTALAVMIETMAVHIASLPCAVNINCHASRHAKEVL
ncbi:MAG: fumarate hydratase [Treponema sp.]|nr:fumarate hydratase [Treponema sp.]